MKSFVRRINDLFIAAVLVGTYVVGIGLARVLYGFANKRTGSRNTYWITEPDAAPEPGATPY